MLTTDGRSKLTDFSMWHAWQYTHTHTHTHTRARAHNHEGGKSRGEKTDENKHTRHKGKLICAKTQNIQRIGMHDGRCNCYKLHTLTWRKRTKAKLHLLTFNKTALSTKCMHSNSLKQLVFRKLTIATPLHATTFLSFRFKKEKKKKKKKTTTVHSLDCR